jgi:deoxyribonuclease V
MILALDVDYREKNANASGILFSSWKDNAPKSEYSVKIENIEDYIPGMFFKRELPCLTKLIDLITEEISVMLVDGYVWLNSEYKPGLGAYLYEKYQRRVPVIGVAKRNFHSSGQNCRQIVRGKSQSPLYVTSAGIDIDTAADLIKNMAGDNRIPVLLKRVDSLCRQW